jgi:hypothetical protein
MAASTFHYEPPVKIVGDGRQRIEILDGVDIDIHDGCQINFLDGPRTKHVIFESHEVQTITDGMTVKFETVRGDPIFTPNADGSVLEGATGGKYLVKYKLDYFPWDYKITFYVCVRLVNGKAKIYDIPVTNFGQNVILEGEFYIDYNSGEPLQLQICTHCAGRDPIKSRLGTVPTVKWEDFKAVTARLTIIKPL